MGEIKKSKKGIDYIPIKILLDKTRVVTKALLEKIPHNTKDDEVCLKIGRYKKITTRYGQVQEVESKEPKSELTLNGIELTNLISYLQDNYEPLKEGVSKFISLDDSFSDKNINYLKELFNYSDKNELIELLLKNNVVSNEILLGIEYANRLIAVEEFENMLEKDLREIEWQKWFKKNDWILGSEFVKILDERTIDTKNISDFLMQAYDGFLDIIEIKRPHMDLPFWAKTKDHNNYYPSSELIKAITQSNNYIYEVERESNSQKFIDRVGGIRTIKPRCILIYGRSNDWNNEQKESYRLLNSSYHSLSILTYDQVLERAKRILNISDEFFEDETKDNYDDVPF